MRIKAFYRWIFLSLLLSFLLPLSNVEAAKKVELIGQRDTQFQSSIHSRSA